MKNYHLEITELAESFFGELTFEQLESIFDVKLIGLEDSEIEATLIKIEEEWRELSWTEVMQIIGDYSIQ